jgi:hypothetical protein
LALMAAKAAWQGTATDLLAELGRHKAAGRRFGDWPKNGQVLSCVIRRLAPSLGMAGVSVVQSRLGKDRRRTISLERTLSLASAPTAVSANDSSSEDFPLFAADAISPACVHPASADGTVASAHHEKTTAQTARRTHADGADADFPHCSCNDDLAVMDPAVVSPGPTAAAADVDWAEALGGR